MNIFIDTEFTHLPDQLNPESPGLISIGCASQNDKKFYAENADFNVDQCSYFVIETVLPLLEGHEVSMPYSMVAKQLKEYVESFESEVAMWSDAPSFDWPFIKHLFDTCGWPKNLNKEPMRLIFNGNKADRFNNAVENAFRTIKPALRRHHALDDAVANKLAYMKAIEYYSLKSK